MSDNRDWYLCGIKRAEEKIESELILIKGYQANLKELCGTLKSGNGVLEYGVIDYIWKMAYCRSALDRARNRARLYVKIKKNLERGVRL